MVTSKQLGNFQLMIFCCIDVSGLYVVSTKLNFCQILGPHLNTTADLDVGTIADALEIFHQCALIPRVYNAGLPLLISIDSAREGFDGALLYFHVADRANSVSAS